MAVLDIRSMQVLVLLLDTFTLTSPLYLGLYNIFDASSV
jgi:hypothetical protein